MDKQELLSHFEQDRAYSQTLFLEEVSQLIKFVKSANDFVEKTRIISDQMQAQIATLTRIEDKIDLVHSQTIREEVIHDDT